MKGKVGVFFFWGGGGGGVCVCGGVLDDGFTYMEIYMKGKVFRKGDVLLQEGRSLAVGSLTWTFI